MLIKVEKFRDVSDFKKLTNKRYEMKRNFLFSMNNSKFKKLSIIKNVFSAKVQCLNLTLALKI